MKPSKPTPKTGAREETSSAKLTYRQPKVVRIGKVEALTRGNGATYTDSLGDLKTRYG